MSSQTESRLQ